MVYVSINKDDLVQEASNNRGENTANGTKFIHTNGTSKGNFSDAFNEKIKKRTEIETVCRELVLDNYVLSVIEKRLRDAMEKGLKEKTHNEASVKCFPTFVRELPTGKEHGKFLALDLGGTNFRVLVIDIAENKFDMQSKVYSMEQDITRGAGEELFDYIVDCLASFMKEQGIENEVLPLGFTFSFPCKQKGLASGELIVWTKGFTASGVVGNDVVTLLENAILKRDDIKVDITALLNDTTGCLMSCAWQHPECKIGLIIGTGTNACYIEHVNEIEMIDRDNEELSEEEQHHEMVINTEWGAFGDKGEIDFLRTKWDKAVDQASLNPGRQTFEKLISGMYMGEIVRQVVLDLVEKKLIFENQSLDRLKVAGKFESKYVSMVESDPVGVFDKCREVLTELGMEDVSNEDCSTLRYVCECVSRRAGFMVAAGCTALLKKMNRKDVTIAVDGSLFRYHPHFANVMQSRINQLMGTDFKVKLMLSDDGSGRGAALVAAALSSKKKQ